MKNLFIKDIKNIAISNNNIEKFNKHILREGKYSFLLPEGWDIESINNDNNYVIATFNNNENIHGSISIVNKSETNIYNNIEGNINSSKFIEDNYIYNNIIESNDKNINNYYIREYSEGKVLIIKFSYKEGKIKNSMKIVFDYISRSFL